MSYKNNSRDTNLRNLIKDIYSNHFSKKQILKEIVFITVVLFKWISQFVWAI